MAGGGGSVDDIWAQLKAKTAPAHTAARAKELLRSAQGISSAPVGPSGQAKQEWPSAASSSSARPQNYNGPMCRKGAAAPSILEAGPVAMHAYLFNTT